MNETRIKKFSSFFFFLLNIFYGEKETLWGTRLILSCIYVMLYMSCIYVIYFMKVGTIKFICLLSTKNNLLISFFTVRTVVPWNFKKIKLEGILIKIKIS